MRTIRKILALFFICTLVTATLLVSGCTENADDLENVNNEKIETETISISNIIDIEWQWSGLVETEPSRQSVIPNPENYTLTFRSDGTYSIKADCNIGSGDYTLEGNNLTLSSGSMTLAYCGTNSLDIQYLSLLNNVTNIKIKDDQLVLGIEGNSDTILFVKEKKSTENNEASELLSFNGTISSFENGEHYPMFLLESEEISSSGYTEGIKFVISEETVILDPNGGLFDEDNLKEGMTVRTFFDPVMTRSIPPIGQAKLIQMK